MNLTQAENKLNEVNNQIKLAYTELDKIEEAKGREAATEYFFDVVQRLQDRKTELVNLVRELKANAQNEKLELAVELPNVDTTDENASMAEIKQQMKDRSVEFAKKMLTVASKVNEVRLTLRGQERKDYIKDLEERYGKGLTSLLMTNDVARMVSEIERGTISQIRNLEAKIEPVRSELGNFVLEQQVNGTYGGTFVGKTKVVTIQVILAGGYNIQRLHCRTLVKTKDIK
jgi:hypothetical protein